MNEIQELLQQIEEARYESTEANTSYIEEILCEKYREIEAFKEEYVEYFI